MQQQLADVVHIAGIQVLPTQPLARRGTCTLHNSSVTVKVLELLIELNGCWRPVFRLLAGCWHAQPSVCIIHC